VEISRPHHHQTCQRTPKKLIASLVWVAFPRNASIFCAYSASRTDVPQPMESTKIFLTALVNMKIHPKTPKNKQKYNNLKY
jgi:hypothetical protein